MNLRYLKEFLAVVDHQGFTAAAAHLHTAQPAISRSIRLLEEELEIVPLVRGRCGLSLTAEGRAFAGHAGAILAQVDAPREAVAGLRLPGDADVPAARALRDFLVAFFARNAAEEPAG